MTHRVSQSVRICNKRGLHARASAKFVTLAEQFAAEIRVARDHETVNANSIMGLMMLGAGLGTQITITAEGEDAQPALEALIALIETKFSEDESVP